MSNAPIHQIDPEAFWRDPYPDLKRMRAETPICFVPQLGATLITRRDDIFTNERNIEVFSSDQPNGLMTKLMGQNMMRKDGAAHRAERKATFPVWSPATVKQVWEAQFRALTARALDEIALKGRADMVREVAMRISGEALCAITGLTNMSWQEMDRVSQGMIDGCANYRGDPAVEANCHDCTASIDRHIDAMIPVLTAKPDHSLLSIQLQAGFSEDQVRANVKLAISGGQNEPRDAIAGMVWALLTHPEQLAMVQAGEVSWMDAFHEYVRWIAPIQMSPRRIARTHDLGGVTLEPDDLVFFMFGSGNRDESQFARPDDFDVTQDTTASIPFGAGPHFCAGAAASRSLIADVAVPAIFQRLAGLRLDGETRFGGWAFRGPLQMPVLWGTA